MVPRVTLTVFQIEGERKGGLLKAETMRRLHTPPEGNDYACGWLCFKRDWAGGRALWHDGSNTLWYMSMWLAPEKDFVVVIATNIGGSDAEKGADEVVNMMVKRWLPHQDDKLNNRSRAEPPAGGDGKPAPQP